MLTIFDAVNWETMPKGQPILVYVDGDYVTYPQALALHPPLFFTVTTTGKSMADICDVESGDVQPAQAIFGVRLGMWHTIYSDRSTLPALMAASRAQGSPEWSWFCADPTGVPHLPGGASACQYAWHSLGQCPADYDISVALESWVQKATQPQTQAKGTDDMQTTELSDGRLVTPGIGAGPSSGHVLLFITNQDGTHPSVIDVTDGAGNTGPNGSLYTVSA
jgi:hypothetical protein